MNTKGIRFVHERTTPMHIDTMEKAAEAIGRAIRERDARIAEGKPLTTDQDPVKFGRHCAWLVGFDHIIDDRKAIRDFVEKIVEAN